MAVEEAVILFLTLGLCLHPTPFSLRDSGLPPQFQHRFKLLEGAHESGDPSTLSILRFIWNFHGGWMVKKRDRLIIARHRRSWEVG